VLSSAPPQGTSLDLVRRPSAASLLWVLLPFAGFSLATPAVLFLLDDETRTVALLLLFTATLFCAALVIALVSRRRKLAYRLLLEPRGVILVDAAGAQLGVLGVPPLTLSPGHFLSGSRSGIRMNQCLQIGSHFSIGTYGMGFGPYAMRVPNVGRPDFMLHAAEWDRLVHALPELRALQSAP